MIKFWKKYGLQIEIFVITFGIVIYIIGIIWENPSQIKWHKLSLIGLFSFLLYEKINKLIKRKRENKTKIFIEEKRITE